MVWNKDQKKSVIQGTVIPIKQGENEHMATGWPKNHYQQNAFPAHKVMQHFIDFHIPNESETKIIWRGGCESVCTCTTVTALQNPGESG